MNIRNDKVTEAHVSGRTVRWQIEGETRLRMQMFPSAKTAKAFHTYLLTLQSPQDYPAYTIVLEHMPYSGFNRSLDGYWEPPVSPQHMTVDVDTLAEAKRVWLSWIDMNALGSGNIPVDSGRITQADGMVVGRMSYNGRCWDDNGHEIVID